MRVALLALLLVGCTTGGRVHYVGWAPDEQTVYLLTVDNQAARAICEGMGARFSLTWPSGVPRVYGCYFGPTVAPDHADVHLIVCPQDSRWCLDHEREHRARGRFHPES